MNKNERIEAAIRNSVMEYMSYKGSKRDRLLVSQWQAIYMLADGYGQIDQAFAQEQCWDWSHVRDSSPKAFENMWEAICHYEDRKQTLNHSVSC